MSADQKLLQKLQTNKESAFLFRRRREPDWSDNYMLYRDKVQLNRLTQRQSVNVPIIKSTVKTLLTHVDEPPILYFNSLANDEQKEVYYNEYHKVNARATHLVMKDLVDKRQVMLFGRSFKALNIANGDFFHEIVDPQDMLIDRYVDPSDIDSARFLIREHLYVPLSSLRTNPMYDTAAVRELQKFFATKEGLFKAEQNQLDWVEKNRRMADMGVIDVYYPTLGEAYVELNEFFVKEFDNADKKDKIKFVVTAEDMQVLFSAPLDKVIGPTRDDFWQSHYPYTTWGDETERTDFWSDGVVDPLRTINKIANAFFSQKVENRTLRNFGMNYFNSSLTEEGFSPQTFEAVPWGWYPIPAGANGKIGDQIMHVDIPDISGTDKDMEFLMTIAQQVSAATNTQQGVPDKQEVTLGEVKLLLASAQQRVKSMAVYYTEAWKDFGQKYIKMLEAAGDLITPTEINKKGRTTKKNYSKVISPKDWMDELGYEVEVKMKEDQQAQTADSLQKLQFSKTLMPGNMALDTIIKKKSLEFSDLSANEISEVIREEEDRMKALAAQPQVANGMPQVGAPGQAMMPTNGAQQPVAGAPMGA